MTLPPMLKRTRDAIASSGALGITLQDIAYAIAWYEPGHGPLSTKTVGAHIDRVRARGIPVVCFFAAGQWRYKLAAPLPALHLAASTVDLGFPLNGAIAGELGRRQPRQLHDDRKPVLGHPFPLIHGKARNLASLRDGIHQPARLGDFLQSSTPVSHSNLISSTQAKVKRLTDVKLNGKQAT